MIIDAWHPCAHNPSVKNDPRQYYLHYRNGQGYWPTLSVREMVTRVFEELIKMLVTNEIEDRTSEDSK